MEGSTWKYPIPIEDAFLFVGRPRNWREFRLRKFWLGHLRECSIRFTLLNKKAIWQNCQRPLRTHNPLRGVSLIDPGIRFNVAKTRYWLQLVTKVRSRHFSIRLRSKNRKKQQQGYAKSTDFLLSKTARVRPRNSGSC